MAGRKKNSENKVFDDFCGSETDRTSSSPRVAFELSNSASGSSCNSGGRVSPDSQAVEERSDPDHRGGYLGRPPSVVYNRNRRISGSKGEDHVMRTKRGQKVVYTAGRPPWYDWQGKLLNEPFIIGICGGSASGKTTVANKIIEALDMPWVTLLTMDSFYKVLTEEHHAKAACNEYDFDHPDAFDFDLLLDTIQKLKEGKSVEVPVYNFSTHSREKQAVPMYGADVLIFEGILCFHRKDILEMMDLKIFVDTDSDTRLARRLRRDILDRGRDIEGVLKQYESFVKPSFDSFIAPVMQHADIIIPRGGENKVALDLIIKHVERHLELRGYNAKASAHSRAFLVENGKYPMAMPESLYVLKETPQVVGIQTIIRNRNTSRDELIFYSKRLIRILLEYALSLLPYESVRVPTPQGPEYEGRNNLFREKICGVSILRAGETMETPLREVVKDCKMGKILIQTNPKSQEPELYFLRLPKDIQNYKVLLMDATVATGAAAMMAIRVLIDHGVPPENVMLISLIMAETGVHSVGYAHPKVRMVAAAVDKELNERFHILPGMGNFGDRFFGTEVEVGFSESEESEED